MKKLFALIVLVSALSSCRKNCTNMKAIESQKISGTLHYSDPAVDGAGLTYQTDNGENLLFKNEDADLYTQHMRYKDLVDVHSSLTYQDTKTTGCPFSMNPDYCNQHPLRVVLVIQLIKQ